MYKSLSIRYFFSSLRFQQSIYEDLFWSPEKFHNSSKKAAGTHRRRQETHVNPEVITLLGKDVTRGWPEGDPIETDQTTRLEVKCSGRTISGILVQVLWEMYEVLTASSTRQSMTVKSADEVAGPPTNKLCIYQW